LGYHLFQKREMTRPTDKSTFLRKNLKPEMAAIGRRVCCSQIFVGMDGFFPRNASREKHHRHGLGLSTA
jgi:hypothetical protein